MRFWDTSAITPLIVEEPASPACRALYRTDAEFVVWTLTEVEIASAIFRRMREGHLRSGQATRAIGRLRRHAARWREVEDLLAVRVRAIGLLRAHRLRAADAMQLAAALIFYRNRPRRQPFITADEGLLVAAAAEGFSAVRPMPA